MTSKQFLEKGVKIAKRIKAHESEIKMLKEVASATGAIRYDTDKVLSSKNGAQFETPIINAVDLENAVKSEMRAFLHDFYEIHCAINQIEDEDVQNVIRMRYLADEEIDVIAYKLKISRRTVIRRLEDGYLEISRITGYPAPAIKQPLKKEKHGEARRIMREFYEKEE